MQQALLDSPIELSKACFGRSDEILQRHVEGGRGSREGDAAGRPKILLDRSVKGGECALGPEPGALDEVAHKHRGCRRRRFQARCDRIKGGAWRAGMAEADN
ncbi:hypothetical protein [Methylorubrum aminovorans]